MSDTERGNAASKSAKIVVSKGKTIAQAAKNVIPKPKSKSKTAASGATETAASVPQAQASTSASTQAPATAPTPPHASLAASIKSSASNAPTPPQAAPVASTKSSASSESTATRATKVPVPGGRNTPDGRLRKCILIGINYLNCPTVNTLKGCANDVVAVRKLLNDDYKYQHAGVLCDDDACMNQNGITNYEPPTKDNIKRGLRHLIGSDTPKSGDFFFFYYQVAGHGDIMALPVQRPASSSGSTPAPTSSSAPAPVAASSSGTSDNSIKKALLLVNPNFNVKKDPYETYLLALAASGPNTTSLNYTEKDFKQDYVTHFSSIEGLQFFVMIDACKSGTFIDLPWRYDPVSNKIGKAKNIKITKEQEEKNLEYYRSIKATIILLSATDSDNLAKETSDRRGLVTKMFTEKIAPILKDNLYDGMALAALMQTLKQHTGTQTPYLSMSKKLPENTMINFKNND